MARILVVDDVPEIRLQLSMLLSMNGHQVDQAENGEIAKQAMKSSTYDIVITDVFMPKVDGFALLQNILKSSPSTKTIAISGGAHGLTPDLPMRSMDAIGADATLSKPFENDDLMSVVNSLLQH
jgi:CheY-like chemotaxis protein